VFELDTNTSVGERKSRSTGKERDNETGLDYFGARYYGSNMGRWMSPDWSAKQEPVPYAKLDNPQTLNLYSYVLNNPVSKNDPDGHATCANPPSCTMATIDSHPAGANGPTITFKNDNPKGKDPNQPVTTKTAVMVENAVVKSGVKSVNVNSTTGGKHGANSNHAKGRGVDIDTVNGTPVRSQGASPAVKSLQGAFAASPDLRENFGPARMEKTSTTGDSAKTIPNSKLAEDHEGHLHVSSQP
jgi:RHS repeat-associated protein